MASQQSRRPSIGNRNSWGGRRLVATTILLLAVALAIGGCASVTPAPEDVDATREALRAEVVATLMAESALAATVEETATAEPTATVEPSEGQPTPSPTVEAETTGESAWEIAVYVALWNRGYCEAMLEDVSGGVATMDGISRMVVATISNAMPGLIAEWQPAEGQEELWEQLSASAVAVAVIVEEWAPEGSLSEERQMELEALCSQLDDEFKAVTAQAGAADLEDSRLAEMQRELDEWFAELGRSEEAAIVPTVPPQPTATPTTAPPAVEILDHGCVTVDGRLLCFAKLQNPSEMAALGWTEASIHVFDEDGISIRGLDAYVQILFPGETRALVETGSLPDGATYGSTLVETSRPRVPDSDLGMAVYPFTVGDPSFEPGTYYDTVTCVIGNESDRTIEDASVEVVMFGADGQFIGAGEGWLPVLLPGGKARAEVDVRTIPDREPALIEVYPALASITVVR